MTTTKTGKKIDTFGPNTLDVRVRERFLASGQLDPKALEKHLGELPDAGERGEGIELQQPALFGGAGHDEDE